jgi:Uncharacterized protein involved in propionate catabolism
MRISLKFYSCVGSNHTTLDAIKSLQGKTPFGADDIASIVVHGSQVTVEHVGWPYQPQGLVSAQLNLPYCVATLLLEGMMHSWNSSPKRPSATNGGSSYRKR